MSDLLPPRSGWSLESQGAPPRAGLFRLLGALAAFGAYFLQRELAPERGIELIWALPLASYLLVANLPRFRLSPPQDELSRLQSSLTVELRWVAIALSFAGLIASGLWAKRSLEPRCPPLASAALAELTEPGFGCRRIEGRPLSVEYLRWESPFEELEEAPYLTPVEEFEGRLLLISAQRLPETREPGRYEGRLQSFPYGSEIRTLSYRSRWQLAPRTPLYLLDLRPTLRFLPEPWAGILTSLLLILSFWGSPTRRPGSSGNLYIPPQLQGEASLAGESPLASGTETEGAEERMEEREEERSGAAGQVSSGEEIGERGGEANAAQSKPS